jgi:transcriptional regulator NrdR family protein
MKCPICNSPTKVLNSRPREKGVRRIRECVECLTRFSTMENLLIESLDKHLRKKFLAR